MESVIIKQSNEFNIGDILYFDDDCFERFKNNYLVNAPNLKYFEIFDKIIIGDK